MNDSQPQKEKTVPTYRDMADEWKQGQVGEFTRCNFMIVAALMQFDLPDQIQNELYDKMKAVLDEHPDHADTVTRIIRIGWRGLYEHGIRVARPEGEYTITLKLNVEGSAPYGAVVTVGCPRISRPGEHPPQVGPKRSGRRRSRGT